MYIENLTAQAGSFEEFVASQSLCKVCDKIVQIPGKKCLRCSNVICNGCMDRVDEIECIGCKKGSLKELDVRQIYLLRKLMFKCPNKACGKVPTQYAYSDYQRHVLVHSRDLELQYLNKNEDEFKLIKTARQSKSQAESKDRRLLESEFQVQSQQIPEIQEYEDQERQIVQKGAHHNDQNSYAMRVKKHNFWTDEEDKALIKFKEHYGDENWVCVAQVMNALGYKNRSSNQCSSRWNRTLSVDKSPMTQDEENILIDSYRKQFSFLEISKMLDRRSSQWVRVQYLTLYRNNLRIMKQILSDKLKNDEIGTLVKNGRISEQNFAHLPQRQRKTFAESLKFIKDDRHAHMQLRQELESALRCKQRDPIKPNEKSRNPKANKRIQPQDSPKQVQLGQKRRFSQV